MCSPGGYNECISDECVYARRSSFAMRSSHTTRGVCSQRLCERLSCLLRPAGQWGHRQNFRRVVHQREFNACTPNHCATVSDRDVPCGLDTALETRVLKGCAKYCHTHLPPSTSGGQWGRRPNLRRFARHGRRAKLGFDHGPNYHLQLFSIRWVVSFSHVSIMLSW